ncbi:MAG: glycosyltransferase family 2 protein [bacterium]|nr:glycosyltransferase family 2 protein [bacterium]
MREPGVAIVVLTYDGFELVRETLKSIGALEYSNVDVLVVDNGSSDSTRSNIRQKFPDAEVLRSEVNLGVAGGFNVGLRWVLNGDWKYALLMHNDVEPEPSMLRELVKKAESEPRAAAVGPKIHLFWDRERLLSAGGLLRVGRVPVKWRGYDAIDRGQYDVDRQVDCVTSAAMLINLEAVWRVGLFDPQLRHFEDADWCLRAREAGFESFYCHRAAAWRLAVRWAPDRPARAVEAGRSAAFLIRRHAALGRRVLFFLTTVGALVPALMERWFRKRRSPLARARGALAAGSATLADPPRAQ